MGFRSRMVFVLVPVISLILLFTAPRQPVSEGAGIVPHSVIYNIDASSWPGATIFAESGIAMGDDHCLFYDSGSGQASSDGRGEVTVIGTVSLDPGTCTRTVASATYRVDAVPQSVQGSLDWEAVQMVPSPLIPVRPGRGLLPAEETTWNGSLSVVVRDPLNLTITKTVAALAWTGTDTSVTSWDASFADSWATWSGWSRYAGRYDLSGGGETFAYADTAAYYKNDLFCPGASNTTYSAHSVTYFRGEPDGGWRWARSLNYSGGCSWMLHDTVTLVTP